MPVTASAPTVCQTADTGSDKTADPHKCIEPTDPQQTYEYQLALLFRDGNEYTNFTGLDPKLNVYVEYSTRWYFARANIAAGSRVIITVTGNIIICLL